MVKKISKTFHTGSIKKTISINASKQKVWQKISNITGLPLWVVDVKITSATAEVYESWWDYKADVTVKVANYGDLSAPANSVTITVQSWSSTSLYDEESVTYNQIITSGSELTDEITVDVDDSNVSGTYFEVILFYNNVQVDTKTVYG